MAQPLILETAEELREIPGDGARNRRPGKLDMLGHSRGGIGMVQPTPDCRMLEQVICRHDQARWQRFRCREPIERVCKLRAQCLQSGWIIWRACTGRVLDGGHFVPEENVPLGAREIKIAFAGH